MFSSVYEEGPFKEVCIEASRILSHMLSDHGFEFREGAHSGDSMFLVHPEFALITCVRENTLLFAFKEMLSHDSFLDSCEQVPESFETFLVPLLHSISWDIGHLCGETILLQKKLLLVQVLGNGDDGFVYGKRMREAMEILLVFPMFQHGLLILQGSSVVTEGMFSNGCEEAR